MNCIACNTNEYTKCVDDMLQIGYIAEIYKCYKCNGKIEVIYSNATMSRQSIKEYKYLR